MPSAIVVQSSAERPPVEVVAPAVTVERDAPIPTWFGIGGRADRLARPASVAELRECVRMDAALRVLGDGANLLVDDSGVGELVVSLSEPAFTRFDLATSQHSALGTRHYLIPAGASLPKLVTDTVRRGLAGLEGLGGVPATLGGAVIMNAGGAFGEIGNVVARVHAVDREGGEVVLERSQIDFGYRRSGLNHLILTAVELNLVPGDPVALRTRLKDVMAYKKSTQPMAEKSAGCVFRNPALDRDLPGIAQAGRRVSAGMLIDRAGLKGLRIGGAEVSEGHANFIVTRGGATARDVIRLMSEVQKRVVEALGVSLEPEVVIWRREP